MKKIYKSYCAVAFATLIVMAGCGKDNATGPDDFTGTSTISGILAAPDGTTPISGATVYVPDNSNPKSPVSGRATSMGLAGEAAQVNCSDPPESYSATTCSEADGNFQFDVPVELGLVMLKVKKGAFSFSTTVEVDGEQADIGVVAMPSDVEELETKMAVVTGSYDHMQDILAKLGFGDMDDFGQLVLGSEQFDLYNGDFSLPESYPEYTGLFEDGDGDSQPDINNYDIVFFNCGAEELPLEDVNFKAGAHRPLDHKARSELGYLMDQEDIDALRAFVEDGGTLYVTDLAYDYVEQVFPEFIDFHGSDTTVTEGAEPMNMAEVGESDITTDATISDPDLNNWLDTVSCEGGSCLNGDGTVHIAGFLPGWAVIDGPEPGSGVNFWAGGDVSWYDADMFNLTSGVKPLTGSFFVGAGKVIYSSYHTEEEEPGPDWKPQERILQYLVFE